MRRRRVLRPHGERPPRSGAEEHMPHLFLLRVHKVFRGLKTILQLWLKFWFHIKTCWLIASAFGCSAVTVWLCRPAYMDRADNMIGWPLKSTSVNTNDQSTCFLKCHGQYPPLYLSPLFFFSTSLPTWALWWGSICHVCRTFLVSFFSCGWRGLLGWLASCSPSWSSSCAVLVLVCARRHTL